MKVLPVDPASPRDDKLAAAVAVVADGGIVALPTETFYGLAVDSFAPEALARLNRLKGKPADAPILLLMSAAHQASLVAGEIPEQFGRLAERFWPGPLTLVVPASDSLPREVGGGRGTVALRVPGLALPRRLAEGLGRPVSGVSANRTGEPPCRTAAETAAAFPEGLAMILDGGPSLGGASSTIVDLTETPARVLREGLLPLSALGPFLDRPRSRR